MWTIWVNLGYLGEFEKMLRVSQKIGSFWRYRCWAIFDNYYIRMGKFPDIPRDPNRYISKYLLLSFLTGGPEIPGVKPPVLEFTAFKSGQKY